MSLIELYTTIDRSPWRNYLLDLNMKIEMCRFIFSKSLLLIPILFIYTQGENQLFRGYYGDADYTHDAKTQATSVFGSTIYSPNETKSLRIDLGVYLEDVQMTASNFASEMHSCQSLFISLLSKQVQDICESCTECNFVAPSEEPSSIIINSVLDAGEWQIVNVKVNSLCLTKSCALYLDEYDFSDLSKPNPMHGLNIDLTITIAINYNADEEKTRTNVMASLHSKSFKLDCS